VITSHYTQEESVLTIGTRKILSSAGMNRR
jgi:hypothetical protein